MHPFKELHQVLVAFQTLLTRIGIIGLDNEPSLSLFNLLILIFILLQLNVLLF